MKMLVLIFFLMPLMALSKGDTEDPVALVGFPQWKDRGVIQKKFFEKTLKLEIAPQVGGILNEPYNNAITYGGSMAFHFSETWGLEFLSFGMVSNSPTVALLDLRSRMIEPGRLDSRY